jgi:midasin (ATPase involved in ribosome maturation)
VLLVGQEGCGVTQVARWAADHYSRQHGVVRGSASSFCFTYWIGRLIPFAKAAAGCESIVWQHGPLTKAVVAGHCGVLDCIDAAAGKVSERLNGLLDPKETAEDVFFDVPENSNHPKVNYYPHFLLISFSTYEGLDALSPALLNRFNVVYLSQLEGMNSDDRQALISPLFRITLPDEDRAKVIPSLEAEFTFLLWPARQCYFK